jgi:hypothetical protein
VAYWHVAREIGSGLRSDPVSRKNGSMAGSNGLHNEQSHHVFITPVVICVSSLCNP